MGILRLVVPLGLEGCATTTRGLGRGATGELRSRAFQQTAAVRDAALTPSARPRLAGA
jgi:hypothetical protein